MESLRKEIDGIDEELLKLLIKRYEYVKSIGVLKHQKNHSIYVPEREKSLLSRLEKLNNGVISDNTLKAVFIEIISGGRHVERPILIVCKKEKPFLYAYAAYAKFGKSISLLFLDSYKKMFSKVKESTSNYSIILCDDNDDPKDVPLSDLSEFGLYVCDEIIMRNPAEPENRKKFLVIGNSTSGK